MIDTPSLDNLIPKKTGCIGNSVYGRLDLPRFAIYWITTLVMHLKLRLFNSCGRWKYRQRPNLERLGNEMKQTKKVALWEH